MTHPNPTPPKSNCTPCLTVVLVALVVLALAFGWVVMVVQKVFGGSAMEHCCTIEGVPFNYLGIFVFLSGVVAAILVAVAFQVRDWLLRRDFERKYGAKVPATVGSSSSYSSSESGPSFHGVDYSDGD